MVVVYHPHPDAPGSNLAALTGLAHARIEADWASFVDAARTASVAVLFAPVVDPALRAKLAYLAWTLGPIPIVLLSDEQSGEGGGLPLDAVLTCADARWSLPAVIDRLKAVPRRARLASLVAGVFADAHTEVRHALCWLLEAEEPARSAVDLVSHVFCDRSTLYRAWESTAAHKRGVSLHQIVNQALAIRTAELAEKRRSRWRIAADLGIDGERLATLLDPSLARSREDPVHAACLAFWTLIRSDPPTGA